MGKPTIGFFSGFKGLINRFCTFYWFKNSKNPTIDYFSLIQIMFVLFLGKCVSVHVFGH